MYKKKEQLSTEQKFELMMEKFKKTSSEILKDAGHKQYSKKEKMHIKLNRNKRKK